MKYLAFLTLILVLPLLALAQGIEEATFVPITNIPAFTEVGNAITTPDGLSAFLNNIYKLCIGAAAVLAVLQIMRAGIIYMGGDSVTEKKEAKNLIALAIGGLILVLSPVVVFSIINPEILNLEIKGIKDLETKSSTTPYGDASWTDTTSPRAEAQARCQADGGTMTFTCSPREGNGPSRQVPISEACRDTERPSNVCRGATKAVEGKVCSDFTVTAVPQGSLCNGAVGSTRINATCCGEMSPGATCCGKLKTDPQTPPVTVEYGWRVRVENAQGGGGQRTDQGNGFTSTASCDASLSKHLSDNNLNMSDSQPSQCFCNKPLSEQPTCSTLRSS